ncbi:RHS repeat-associated core domain-containing protein, partial [Xanthomonas arboricola]
IEPDHLGSPRVVVDAARDVAVWNWSLKGEAFGNTAPNQDPDGDGTAMVFDMRFPGQRFDVASGFNQNYFRDYDAATGRYGQSDPIGLNGGISTYQYALGKPLIASDKSGQKTYVIVTRDLGIGSHTAMLIDSENGAPPFLYDPAGSYMGETRGSGGVFEGVDGGASLRSYVDYQKSTGSSVEVIVLNTTARQENRFKMEAEELGDSRGFSCASSISSVMSGYCGIVSHTIFPGRLADMLNEARNKERSESCVDGGK